MVGCFREEQTEGGEKEDEDEEMVMIGNECGEEFVGRASSTSSTSSNREGTRCLFFLLMLTGKSVSQSAISYSHFTPGQHHHYWPPERSPAGE